MAWEMRLAPGERTLVVCGKTPATATLGTIYRLDKQ